MLTHCLGGGPAITTRDRIDDGVVFKVGTVVRRRPAAGAHQMAPYDILPHGIDQILDFDQ